MNSETLDKYIGRRVLALTVKKEWELGLLRKTGNEYTLSIAGTSVNLAGCVSAYALRESPEFGSICTCHLKMERVTQEGIRRWVPSWNVPTDVLYLGERTIFNGKVQLQRKWFGKDKKEFLRTKHMSVSLVCANHYTNPFYTILVEEGSLI